MSGTGKQARATREGDTPSLQLVYDLAREQYHRQKARRESLVGRSSTFLGLLAVFIGLVVAAPFHQTPWRAFAAIGLGAILLAMVLFVIVVRLADYKETPDVTSFADRYLQREEDETQLQVLANTREAVKCNECQLMRSQSVYQWAAVSATAGTVTVTIGAIVSIIIS